MSKRKMIWRPLRQTLRRFAPRPYRERITTDKREIKDFSKLPSATSFIHRRYTQSAYGVAVWET